VSRHQKKSPKQNASINSKPKTQVLLLAEHKMTANNNRKVWNAHGMVFSGVPSTVVLNLSHDFFNTINFQLN
jgi:hypothetical protein